ncbi:uncharacterized protein [Apostichopus japonicus]|uniref:uncharacterized protein n=1 Tax=Stichopus japonicus TaxID=307972 RepID=UPI003AB34C32
MASTQENTESNVYYEIAENRDQIPEYIEVTGDAEYMRVIPPPSNTTVASAPPAGNVMLTPNIANQQLQGSQPPVNPNYQSTSQPQQLPPQPQPQQPYLQPQMPPHQQQTADNQPQQNPVTYPAPPPYQQYDQKGSLPPPPYQPQEIQTIQPQPIHAMPYNMSQQGQGVVIQQPQQFQQMPFQPVTVINTSDAGQSNLIQGMAITSIVLSAIATVCVLGCLFTIPAIVLGSLALNRSAAEDTRKKFAITSMVLTVTVWIIYVALLLILIFQ